jgi:urea transport system permease protein
MLMLGAYTTFVLTDPSGLPRLAHGIGDLVGVPLNIDFGFSLDLYKAIPIVFLVVGAFGYLMERCLIRFLYGRPLDTLLATWGVGLILQQVVRMVFGGGFEPLSKPTELNRAYEFEGASFPIFRLFVIGVTVVCLVAVYLWFYRTAFGLKIRAVIQNRPMASALGISTPRVDALTFAVGTGLAGVASDYIVAAFMVVILGGMGQLLLGTITGGLLIGICLSVIAKFFGNRLVPDLFPANVSEVNSQMADVAVLVMVICFILARPSGLFATKERVYD